MSDQPIVITYSAEEMQAFRDRHRAELDALEPNWRYRLAGCCLHCSHLEWGPEMKALEGLQTASWMLGETDSWHDFYEKEGLDE